MATGDGGAYSYSLTVFSPSGKLVQIEHALARVSQGTTSLGIKGSYITATSEVSPGQLRLYNSSPDTDFDFVQPQMAS
jgi:20S proteasome alpha/beta subunit